MRRGAPWFNQGANTHWSSFNPDRARGYVLYRESSAGAHCFSSRLDALCRGALLPPPSCVPWSNESDGTILPLRRRVAEAASVVYGAFALPKPKYLRRDRPRHFLLVGVILL